MQDLATKVERIIRTAKDNLCEGTILEPRFWFDEIAVPNSTALRGFSTEGVFKNGESWPIRVTKMVAQLRLLGEDGETEFEDERILQQIGLRLSFHNADYMSREFNALPLWQSRPTGPSQLIAAGLSSHVHDVPWILSARDSMLVSASLDLAPSEGQSREVSVAFTGYGLQTKRPYFKAGSVQLEDTVKVVISPDRFRNDGDEPICMTDMTCHVSAESEANSPMGDTRQARIQVSQVGNGTQANWFAGPIAGAERMQAALLGTRAGRAIVHEFPRPLIWEPGEGLQAEVQPLIADLGGETQAVITLAFYGTIVVSGAGG